MKINQWTIGLAAAGLVTLPSMARADEGEHSHVNTALNSTTLSGYVNSSAHWNWGTGNGNNPMYSFSSGKGDGFNLDAVNLTLQKPLDEAAWASSYIIDLLLGPDANSLATASSLSPESDFAIKQANVGLRAPVGNGLDFKVGVFDTVIGYEVTHAGNNPNYTRSYGYTLEPTTHTGVLMSYQFCEFFGASVGVANTFGPAINQRAFGNDPLEDNNKAESYKTYMVSAAFTVPKDNGFISGSTVYAGFINGFNNNAPGSDVDADTDADGAVQTSYYVGATLNTPIEALKVGAAYDYLHVSGQTLGLGDVPEGRAYAASVYASYQLAEKLSLHGRGEYFVQSDSWAVPGLPDKVIAGTATLQYDLWENVISRLEFRWDHSAGNNGGVAAGDARAYGEDAAGDPDRKNNYLIALNVIYKF